MPTDLVEAQQAGVAAIRTHGHLSESSDLLAELNLNDHEVKETETETTMPSAADLAEPAAKSSATNRSQPEQQTEAVQLTLEQEDAAAECANAFVDLYEKAFLNRAVQLLLKTCQEQGIPESAVAQKLRGRGIDWEQLKARAAEVSRGITECASNDGWKLIQDGKLRLLYRHSPGSTVHSFKGSCLLPAPIVQPMAMAREFDLVNTWNSYITNSPILRTYCDVDLLVYASVWLPWPFAERDVVISAVADDQLRDKGVVAVSFASPRELPPDTALPDGADKRVHIYFTTGSCMTMTPVAAPPAAVDVQPGGAGVAGGSPASQQTQVVIVANIETAMASVPEPIISFVLRVFAPFMYSTVLKVLHKSFDDPSEPLPQRMAAHHELYDMINTRCADYLDGHPDYIT